MLFSYNEKVTFISLYVLSSYDKVIMVQSGYKKTYGCDGSCMEGAMECYCTDYEWEINAVVECA